MKLDYSAFESALGQLELALKYLQSPEGRADPERHKLYRTAAIKSFEYTYETATAMVRRQLAQIVLNPPELRAMPFMDLMRSAADAGLIRDARPFHGYREKRNLTSHTYAEKRAEEVLTIMAPFVADMHFRLAELKRRNA